MAEQRKSWGENHKRRSTRTTKLTVSQYRPWFCEHGSCPTCAEDKPQSIKLGDPWRCLWWLDGGGQVRVTHGYRRGGNRMWMAERVSALEMFMHIVTYCYKLPFCPTIRRYIGLPSFVSPSSSHRASVLLWSHLVASCPVWYLSGVAIRSLMYDTHLRGTHTTTSSIGGVQIPIYLVNNATDSLRWSAVVLKLYQ